MLIFCECRISDERIRPLVCSVDDDLYVFGGYTDRHKEVRYFDTAAKFDTLTNQWQILSPMNHSRSGGQACYAQGTVTRSLYFSHFSV